MKLQIKTLGYRVGGGCGCVLELHQQRSNKKNYPVSTVLKLLNCVGSVSNNKDIRIIGGGGGGFGRVLELHQQRNYRKTTGGGRGGRALA